MPKKKKPILSESDFMLATARTCGAKGHVLEKFTESELIGLAWFSAIPRIFRPDPNASNDFLFNQFNLLLGAFWSAYQRHPDEALLIIGKVRARESEMGALAMRMVLRENPTITKRQLAIRVAEICGTNPLDLETVKKRWQRLNKAARRTPTMVQLIPVDGYKHPKGGFWKGTNSEP